MLYRNWSIAILLFIFIFISGCMDVEMEINHNGSGELKYTIAKTAILSIQNVKDEINKQITQLNHQNNQKVAELKSITTKSDQIEAIVSFSNLNLLNQNISNLTIKKWLEKNPPPAVINVKKGGSESLDQINKNYQIFSINGLSLYSISSLKVVVPGEITHLSSNGTLIEKNRAELTAGTGIIIYKKPSSAVKIFFILVLLSIFLLLLKIIYRKEINSFMNSKQPKA